MKEKINREFVSFRTLYSNYLHVFCCPKKHFSTSGYFWLFHVEPLLDPIRSRWVSFSPIGSGCFWLFLVTSHWIWLFLHNDLILFDYFL